MSVNVVCSCASHPVHNEDLAHSEFLLQQFGGDGDRVEETKAPVHKDRNLLVQPQMQLKSHAFMWGLCGRCTDMAVDSSAWCPGGRTTAKPF